MKLFDFEKDLPKYLQKRGKLHEVLMMLLSFIIMPIVSIVIVTLTCRSVGLRVVQTTVSMLAWYKGKFAIVLVWGALNLALYLYLLKLNLDFQKYSAFMKVVFYVLCGLGMAILIVGISIPLTDNRKLFHDLHNNFAIVGFVALVFVLMLFVLTAYGRNTAQALILSAFLCFFVITGIFSIPQINSPDSTAFVTAATQMYLFAMMHIIFAVDFCLAKYLPPKEKAKREKE